MEKKKQRVMIKWLADNIISPLGHTSGENYRAVCRGESGIVPWKDPAGAPISVSCLDMNKLDRDFQKVCHPHGEYTMVEKTMLLSASLAVEEAGIDASSPRTGFVLSTTKGNIHLLADPSHGFGKDRIHLWHTSGLLSGFFKNPGAPLTVSNACISGACAQIAAQKMLEYGLYDHVVVTGVDMISDFIVSGFQSFKSLDAGRCRPFDARRAGLNLGEAAATIVYGKNNGSGIYLMRGSIRNDANHISGPSRTGEGLYRAITSVMQDLVPKEIAFISAHGTATIYNDQMEAIAFSRSGLEQTPVFSLKAHFGHTLGAAGVLESIIAKHALEEGIILPSLGYEEPGVEGNLNVCQKTEKTDERYIIKTLSGFGGGNAALLFGKQL
ncbi:MAG: beta-ketoacyl synthase N-terminal-like domain-containing protein [Bacteroidales bacterium]|jgi:3-oxoacyl-[acyl-carrier-protein] synthase-1|nr:beta-ketoacyl synthase [Bacteroidales bacterium]MDD2264308.1 beta-ketoacyl synthase N-terminal-like domain-containing protein [Bacteroidales bacterium]MDD2831542.1 beta-ketoacyl synthase N-terminal-like domain-containing protein [Bacteroidales bacterium]MDD5516705.1 beta-ketoacyl synthase N-terminal-like domain-containing protein [Bacteroidales bacterium]HHV02329.1 beta-ketoacyl synthase [Bacteroidales bacterium]